ncbi:MAG: glycosyltransferase family 2 protein [Prevotella sp.]
MPNEEYKNMNKIVTIIISAYNKTQYIERCVHSLIGKNVSKAEIIIVNDGSTDETSVIAHELSKKCESVIVLDKENGHQGSCVNAAMQIATGIYVRMLDADDFFDTEAFDKYLELLGKTDVDMVVTGHVIDGKQENVIAPVNVDYNKVLRLENIDFRKSGNAECIGMHGITYRTEILKTHNIRMTEHCSFTDAEFCYYPMKHCQTVMFIKDVLYHYQTNIDGQESSLKSNKVKEDAYLVCNKMLGDYVFNLTNRGNSDVVLCRCFIAYWGTYLLYFKSNPIDKERTHYLLYQAKRILSPDVYKSILKVTTCKIPFLRIFQLTGMTSYRLFILLDFLRSKFKK